MKRVDNKLWFKAKNYGYGWYPSTWQGWTIILIYFIIVLGSSLLIENKPNPSYYTLAWFMPIVIISTIILVVIAYLKGEKASWRWGKTSRK